jgi:hypothetical protein
MMRSSSMPRRCQTGRVSRRAQLRRSLGALALRQTLRSYSSRSAGGRTDGG